MHAELVGGVTEAGWLTVPCSYLEEGCAAGGPGAGNVLCDCGTFANGYGGSGDEELILVEDHGVSSRLHGWGVEVA